MTTNNPVGIIKKDIYIIKNNINNKAYIGQSLDAAKRFQQHCNKNENSLIHKAIVKYGAKYFRYEVLESQTENYNEREKYWISFYNTISPNGYNLTEGGEEPPTFYGTECPTASITEEETLRLLKDDLKNSKLSLQEIAVKYNTNKRTVGRINQGLSYQSLLDIYPIRKIPNLLGKLTSDQVDEIIELLRYTYRSSSDIGHEYGVECHAISRINSGQTHNREEIDYPIRDWKSSGKPAFTYEQITEIIDKIQNTSLSLRAIAKEYGVEHGIINNINNGSAKRYRRKELQYPLRKP